jgi:hypothetical protein
MRMSSKWNRRGFLGTAAAIAASIVAPRKLFSTADVAARTGAEVLRNSKPAIVIGGEEGRSGLAMCSFMLQPGEDKIVAEQLSRVLREHSA